MRRSPATWWLSTDVPIRSFLGTITTPVLVAMSRKHRVRERVERALGGRWLSKRSFTCSSRTSGTNQGS
jgi:hypothetical protein